MQRQGSERTSSSLASTSRGLRASSGRCRSCGLRSSRSGRRGRARRCGRAGGLRLRLLLRRLRGWLLLGARFLGAGRDARVDLVRVLRLFDDALFAGLRIDFDLLLRDVLLGHEKLNAAVLLFALFGGVVSDRLLDTPALRRELLLRDRLLL